MFSVSLQWGPVMASYTGFAGYKSGSSLNLQSWGMNKYGQTADGTLMDHGIASVAAFGIGFSDYAAGISHSCGVDDTSSGNVYCVGNNNR